jgi:hypothetical protein
MFTISGLQHYSIPNLPNTPTANNSFPIYSISNSSNDFIKQNGINSDLKHASHEVDEAQYMAYSAHTDRAKRAAVERQYSERDCQKNREELSSLVNLAVYHPMSWYQHKSRIEHLQSISKSVDCKAIK